MHVFFIHIFHYLCRHKIITTMKYKEPPEASSIMKEIPPAKQ